jgi:WD40 repeat protein
LADPSAVQLRQECWADDVETLVTKLEGLGIHRQLIQIEPDTAHRLTLVRQLRGHLGGVSDVAISPNGLKLVTAGGAPTMTSFGRLKDGDHVPSLGDRTVRVWRIADGGTIHVLGGHNGWAVAVAVSPDGTTLASGDSEMVQLWDLNTGARIRSLQGNDRTGTALAFSPDGALLAAGSDGGAVTVWRLTDGALLRTSAKHGDRVTSVAFSPTGAVLASGSRDGTVRLWRSPGWDRPTTLRSGPRLGRSSAVRDLAFAPNRDVIAAACEDGRVRQWRVTDGNALPSQAHQGGWATSIAYTPDGSVLGSGSSEGALLLWPVVGGAPRELTTDGYQTNRLAFSADGGTLAAAVWNATTYVWRVRR